MELLIIRKHFERASNLFLIIFLLLFLLFSSVGSASASWSIETIDNVVPSGAKISLSADANGKIHVSYIDYIDATHNSLKYANNVSGSWNTFTVRSGSVFADGVSMAIDSIGKVHICSIEINQGDGNLRDLRYTTNSSGAWVSTLIDTGYSSDPAIAIDSNNKIHISYLDWASYDYLKYATNVSGSWQISTIVDGHTSGIIPCDASAIAVDKNSKAHICYYDCNGNNPPAFRYITNASGVWVDTLIESFGGAGIGGGFQVSIAVDQNNFVHTVYYNTQYDAVNMLPMPTVPGSPQE